MSKYKGARYVGVDPIHLPNGELILNGEVTDLLSHEAALNDQNFEPVFSGVNVEKKISKNTLKVVDSSMKNFKKNKVSKPVDINKYKDGE